MSKEDQSDNLTLRLLEAIDSQADMSQRDLSKRLGVALGLTNSYLKRCVRKGLVKIREAPANRYLYYLTPTGFAEKSRLSLKYLSISLAFYRQAGAACLQALDICLARGCDRIVLCGASDLAEIAAIKAHERPVVVTGVYDPHRSQRPVLSLDVFDTLPVDDCQQTGYLLTDVIDAQATYLDVVERVGAERVAVPSVLTVADRGPRTLLSTMRARSA